MAPRFRNQLITLFSINIDPSAATEYAAISLSSTGIAEGSGAARHFSTNSPRDSKVRARWRDSTDSHSGSFYWHASEQPMGGEKQTCATDLDKHFPAESPTIKLWARSRFRPQPAIAASAHWQRSLARVFDRRILRSWLVLDRVGAKVKMGYEWLASSFSCSLSSTWCFRVSMASRCWSVYLQEPNPHAYWPRSGSSDYCYALRNVNGSGLSAEITNASLSGAHSDLSDVILSGFSFTKGTKAGSGAKATALTVAVNDRSGALDTNVNGTGELINPNYGETVLARVHSTADRSNGGTASDLYIVYGTAGSYASVFVEYSH
jgi:hypothetical protein